MARILTERNSFQIEYVDQKGKESTRPITVNCLDIDTNGKVRLQAECKLRGESRAFLADSIVSIIDYDGEVHSDVYGYLRTYMGLPEDAAAFSQANWNRLFTFANPYLTLMCILADADGRRSSEEIDTAVKVTVSLCKAIGVSVDAASKKRIRRHIADMVIDDAQLSSLDTIERIEDRSKILKALVKVCKADGEFCDEEERILENIMNEVFN